VLHGSAYTVARSTSQCYGDSKILGSQNSEIPEPIDKKFGVGDYVGDDFPHAKIQNDRPIGGVAAYAWNITLTWFLVFLSYPILSYPFCDPKFCSHPETKPYKEPILRGLLYTT